jgi:hypothetical protein
VQTSRNPGNTGTTSATPSSGVVANTTGMSTSLSIEGNGTTLPGTPDHPIQIHDINLEVPQAITTHSSGAVICRYIKFGAYNIF